MRNLLLLLHGKQKNTKTRTKETEPKPTIKLTRHNQKTLSQTVHLPSVKTELRGLLSTWWKHRPYYLWPQLVWHFVKCFVPVSEFRHYLPRKHAHLFQSENWLSCNKTRKISYIMLLRSTPNGNSNQKALIEFKPTPYCCCQSNVH